MSFINTIKGYILPKNKKVSMYTNDDGTPKTSIHTSNSSIFSLPTSLDRNETNMNTYLKYYQNESTVWAAINSIAFNTTMVGYVIESDDNESKNIIDEFNKNNNIDDIILNATIDSLVLGDAFIEIIYNKKGIPSRLKTVDPRTMFIEYDNHGDVKYYVQMIDRKKTKIEPKYICHISLFHKPSSPYGISLIAPSIDIIKKKVRTDNAIANSIIRHGMSKYLVTVGKEGDAELPPESVLTQIKHDLKDIDEKNEFIVPWNVDVKTIDNQGVQGVEEYFNYFQTQLVVGLLCPEESLGLGQGSTAATATVKAILYERMIDSFQRKIARAIESNIYNVILKENGLEPNSVSMNFNSVTEEDEAMRAKWTGDLMKGFRTSNVKPFTINEIRSMFGKKAVDMEEANTLLYGENVYEDDDISEDDLSKEELRNLMVEKENAIYNRKLELIKQLKEELDDQ